jgi:hypothetical protein
MKRMAMALTLSAVLTPVAIAGDVAPSIDRFVSSERNDYNLSVSDDGRIAVFARSDAEFANARIMVAERGRRGRRGRSGPVPIAFSDPRYRDSDPWLTPDGRTLYFVSDRPTAARPDKRDLDIWRSSRDVDGRWSAPEHLGDEVNSKGEELGPELHDGVLYFGSARKSGLGGLDIYRAPAKQGGFHRAQPMPTPINSTASESDFTLSRDGRLALFWRQVGERGLLHISRRTVDGGWTAPQPLPDSINIGAFNFTPFLDSSATRLTFAATPRQGRLRNVADIYHVGWSSVR